MNGQIEKDVYKFVLKFEISEKQESA